MSLLLSCQGLTKSYGPRPLFSGISLGISEGERMGLIGPNGSGKSTLLKLWAALEKPDAGDVSRRRDVRLGYLSQTDDLPPSMTVEEALADALRDSPLDAHERDFEVSLMLGSLGFAQPQQSVQALSGGWRKRLALARALIRKPDLLLLDEPTNHLDLEGILWLEALLKEVPFAFVLVSHDRYFLENVTNRVVELSRAYADGFLSVKGNYSEFLTRKEDYLAAQATRQDALDTQVKREIEWLRRGPQARTTKAQGRIKEAGRLIDDLAEVKFRNSQDRAVDIDFSASGRRTHVLLAAKDIEKRMGGRTLFSHLSFTLSPGLKMGLLGPNGSGKTTLIRLLTGELAPDAGTLKKANDLRVVWFDQNRQTLDKTVSLRRALSPASDTVIYRNSPLHVSGWAKKFLFRPDQLDVPVSQLSGGEQARILLANLMLMPADLLILDEPTNDLDIPSLEVLEDSLQDFPGALLLVTHDRYLLDRVATDVLALDGQGGSAFFAGYEQWERHQTRSTPSQLVVAKAPAKPSAPSPSSRLTASERRELKGMEDTIMAAESDVEALEAQLHDPDVASDHAKLQACWDGLESARIRVAESYTRWEELEARQTG